MQNPASTSSDFQLGTRSPGKQVNEIQASLWGSSEAQPALGGAGGETSALRASLYPALSAPAQTIVGPRSYPQVGSREPESKRGLESILIFAVIANIY